MDAILEPIGEFWNGFISNPIVVAVVQLSIIYVVLLWLGTSYWAFRDMQARTENPILPYFAAALIIFFTPLLFVFAVVLYLIVRPRETLAEVYERSLAEESLLAEVEKNELCPVCRDRVDSDWLVCPNCRTPSRLPVVQPPGRSHVAAVRVLRPRVRASVPRRRASERARADRGAGGDGRGPARGDR
jgi:hypothetical protein